MGFVYKYFDYQLATLFCMVVSSLVIFSIPFLRNVWLLLVLFIINGAVQGFCEAGANVYLQRIWGRETAPFMQLMHSMYGIGALITPAVAAPYLLVKDESEVEEKNDPSRIDLIVPYSFVGAFLVLSVALVGVIYVIWPETKLHPSRRIELPTRVELRLRTASGHGSFSKQQFERQLSQHEEQQQQELAVRNSVATRSEPSIPKSQVMWRQAVVILTMLFMNAFYGIEQGLGSFLTTFAHEGPLKLSKETGAKITTVFWASFAFTRFPKMFMLSHVSNRTNIIIGLVIMFFGNCIFISLGMKAEVALWTSVVVITAGASSLWGSVYAYLDQYFEVTSIIGSLIFVAAVFGEFMYPIIIAFYMKSTDGAILLYVVFGCGLIMCFTFALMVLICSLRLPLRE